MGQAAERITVNMWRLRVRIPSRPPPYLIDGVIVEMMPLFRAPTLRASVMSL